MIVYTDLTMLRRSTRAFELIFTNKTTRRPIDISNWKFYFTAKEKMEDADSAAVINKTITDLTSPTDGKTLVSLTADDTDLDPKSYWYSIDYLSPDGDEDSLFQGKLTIKKSVRDARS